MYLKHFYLVITIAVCCLLLQNNASAQFSVNPSPYCADTTSIADSVYLNGAQLSNYLVIPAVMNQSYLFGNEAWIYLTKGVSSPFQFIASNYPGQALALWIDYNHDTLFSANEKIGNIYPVNGGAVFNVIAPANALTGPTRARMRVTASDTLPDPCSHYAKGSTADFFVIINETAAPYCEPVSMAGCSDQDYIDSFRLNNISYHFTGGQSPGYQFISGQTTLLTTGGSYDMIIKNGSYYGSSYNAWIDYNNNHTFDFGERLNTDISVATDSVLHVNFTVPVGATGGVTRMRIRGNSDSGNTTFSACDTIDYGMTLEFDITINPSGIEKNVNVSSVSIFPNPAEEVIHVDYELASESDIEISVYDLVGRVIYSRKESQRSGKISSVINVVGFAKGMYQLQLKDGSGFVTRKFCVK